MECWDQMPWSSFSECWALNQLFCSPLSLSSRGFLGPLHFLPKLLNDINSCIRIQDIWICYYFRILLFGRAYVGFSVFTLSLSLEFVKLNFFRFCWSRVRIWAQWKKWNILVCTFVAFLTNIFQKAFCRSKGWSNGLFLF